MSPICVFGLLLFSHLTLLSAGHPDKCPPSFDCGHLGSIHFPFTKAELLDCGLLPIYGCDLPSDQPRMIQLEKDGRHLNLTNVLQQENLMTVLDQDLHQRLISNTCETFNNNISLPQNSPLVSFDIKYYVYLFRCNHTLKIRAPTGFFNYTHCSDYDIFYANSSSKDSPAPNSFSACSLLQLPYKDISDTGDILTFLSAKMIIEVQLSDDCDNCFNHLGGHCRLDTNNNFYCDKVPDARHKIKVFKLALGVGLGLSIGLGILIIWRLLGQHCRLTSSNLPLRSTNNDTSDPNFNADPESGRAYYGVPLFSYEELEKATNNFDNSRELGNGGFGTVYYGRLQDGREVAVKRLYDHNYRRVEQFMNEIEILTRLRHQNLVSLYGCTSRHSRELLLVYEYISNGTVSCHLHGELASRCSLPWPIRIKIAVETATALAYLHTSEIIHRDVKTNNILLDGNFCVKVADFGLSRLFPSDVTHVSTAPQGTPGYVDPEYHQCYQLTSKSDVYSFGVVLIELISSMAAVDMRRHKDEINLANLAVNKIQKSALGELVDPSLGFESDSEVRKMIVSVAELAFLCLQRDRELRPSMDEVLEMLRRIESGKEDYEHLEEVDVHGTGISYSDTVHPPSPPSPDCDENGLLKTIMSLPSPKTVIDKWHSESSTTNASA